MQVLYARIPTDCHTDTDNWDGYDGVCVCVLCLLLLLVSVLQNYNLIT